ncbi:GerMN domain-containing protein [Cohnella faecalis]|uniref:GerMN domain-containing protein n=1 Tax=Cohnella faecalis TaxID=2315694 RepID=A0A398CN58_9BACL|nr:GerMN domain-containing protein [Cohnella faecalis]RIE03915.1 hypothetical protein D3H35_08085 [Cohnella faecalis]
MKSSWTRKSRTRLLAAMLLLLPVVSACSLGGGGGEPDVADIDAPPASVEQSMLEQTDEQPSHPSIATVDNAQDGHAVKAGDAAGQAGQAGQVSQEAAGDTVTVYLLDRNGYVAPMTLRTAAESGGKEKGGDNAAGQTLAETALSWMIDNPERRDQLPPGFSALLPAGTKINSVVPDAESRSVTIDFAEPLTGLETGKDRKAIEALVWTMTELPGTDSVKLTVAGKPLQLLPGSSIPVDAKLTRGIGINVEAAKDVQTSARWELLCTSPPVPQKEKAISFLSRASSTVSPTAPEPPCRS